ncbi:diaminopimelate decarboxylase [Candidatus Kaiserbacteria bacterium]|nr:diaminopimelate decarboxylase [Candidatus Kaiserbacteria bacterium]
MEREVPFSKEQIEQLATRHPTPFYVYDAAGIKGAAQGLINAFSWNPGFREYFAVKATPNPAILRLLKQEGCGTDCSSLAELVLSERQGIVEEEIMFTSNDTSAEEFVKARELGAIINLDALELLPYLEQCAGLPELLSFRYNPGAAREGNAIIGKPQEAKFGMTREQIFEGLRQARELGVSRFGLHTMIASNELDSNYFVETARMMFELAQEARGQGIEIEFVNLGGGIGIPYRPEQVAVDIAALGARVHDLYVEMGMHNLKIFLECGRVITGPHGYLVTRVRHLKHTYKHYAGVDACMADLMRPGMYGAYHHVSVLGKEEVLSSQAYDVVGSLCENNDKFAIDRQLPALAPDDILVIHDAGAHGHSMGFNYNGRLRHAEFLLDDGAFTMIRRAETLDDYFATLAF